MRSPASSVPRAARPAIVAALLLGAALGGCRGGDGESATTSTTVALGRVEVELQRGRVTVFGVADGAVLPEEAERAALVGAERYLQSAMVAPLARGEVGERFAGLFAPALHPLVTTGGRDHTVLTDDGVPTATATPEVTTTPVAIDALIAADGTPLLLVAAFRARADAETAAGPVSVARTVELTFEPGDDGWLVTAYEITTTRRGLPGAPTTTTATAGSEDDAA